MRQTDCDFKAVDTSNPVIVLFPEVINIQVVFCVGDGSRVWHNVNLATSCAFTFLF